MSKVKQITLDVVTDDNVDGYELSNMVEKILKQQGINVVGNDFTADLTETYDKFYPDLLKESFSEPHMRIVKIYGGMTGEYELIWTNAPDSLIEEQLTILEYMDECGDYQGEPYALLKSANCIVVVMGTDEYDTSFDRYDYSYDGEDFR